MSSYPFLILSVAAFAGAVVSGATGFVFSAAAGAILLHVMKPIEAVPLMMVCSLGVQGALAVGTAFGIFTFGRINDLAFRRVVLACCSSQELDW